MTALRFALFASVAAVTIGVDAPAYAQSDDAEIQTLRAEVAALKEQLAAISAKLDTVANDAAKPVIAEKPVVADKKGGPEIKFKGAPEISTSDGWSFKPRGRIQFDAATVSAPASIVNDGKGFSNEMRRARLGVEGTIPGGFGYKFELDFAEGGAEFTDAFLSYKDGGLTITAGQHNNFQSLEELTSSNETSFIERSAFTDAFGFERRAGLSVQYKAGAFIGQMGVFTDDFSALTNDGNDTIGYDGRAVFMPKFGETQAHFGASYHWRDLGDTLTSARYRQRPLVHSTDIRFIDTGTLAGAKSESSYGVEAALISGRFHAAAEGHWQKLNRTGFADPSFFGGSIEAGVFLTADKREYKDGVFKAIKVKNPVGKNGFGALQFNVRYDYLDLIDAGIIGGIQNSYQASIIWTPIDYVRFMLNYGKLSYTDAAIAAAGDRDYQVDVLGARAQISF
jgi:phosphate-selective porin OprO and OprP